MTQGSLFAWLHLSDIHIGHGGASHQADQELVLRKLRADVAAQIKAGIPKPDVVLVTGDIAFSGACRDPEEYTRAAAWLKTVADTIGVGLESVYVVPGNHDVQRPVDKPLGAKTLLKSLRRGETHLDEALHDVETRKHLAARQANYLAFAQGVAPAVRSEAPDAPRLFWQDTLEARGGLRVRLCGLNTALLAAEEESFGTDKGALWLGKRQIAEVLPGSPEEGEVVIVLSHHPFSEGWLHDEKNARAWTRSNADIHLSGHVHDADNEQTISGAGGGFVHIAAAATHGEAVPEWVPAQHGYSFGALVAEGDGVVLRVWPRRWSDKLKKFLRNGETIDESAGCATHPIKRVKLPRPSHPGPDAQEEGPKPPTPPVDASVAEAEGRALTLLREHPQVVTSLSRQKLGDDPESIVRALLHDKKAHEVTKALNGAFAHLANDKDATADDQRLLRAIFNECLRFAIDWREVISLGREALRRKQNAFELPTRKESVAELLMAGINDGMPAFDLSRPGAVVGLTRVAFPPILRGAVALTRERLVEATVKHIAGTVFADNPDLDHARAHPQTPEALADVEGTLRAMGFEGASEHGRPYYVVFGTDEADLWQVVCEATRDKLPSLQLVRWTGGADANEAALVAHIKTLLHSPTKP